MIEMTLKSWQQEYKPRMSLDPTPFDVWFNQTLGFRWPLFLGFGGCTEEEKTTIKEKFIQEFKEMENYLMWRDESDPYPNNHVFEVVTAEDSYYVSRGGVRTSQTIGFVATTKPFTMRTSMRYAEICLHGNMHGSMYKLYLRSMAHNIV